MPLAIRDAADPLELERHNSQIRSLFWFAVLGTRVPNAGSKFPVRERHRVMLPCPDKSSQQALQKGPLCLTVEPCSLMFKVGVYLQSQNLLLLGGRPMFKSFRARPFYFSACPKDNNCSSSVLEGADRS